VGKHSIAAIVSHILICVDAQDIARLNIQKTFFEV
jgi:hypothetical protein